MSGKISSAEPDLKPVLLMILSQVVIGAVNILYKLASYDGMNAKIIISYRLLFGTAFIVPIALILERKSRPKLTWMIAFQAFLCGLSGGSVGQYLYAESLVLTSATFAAAMLNLMPAFTFVMAVILRLENLEIHTLAGKAKVLGSVLGIGGAMVLTFYKGQEVQLWSTKSVLHHHAVAASQDHSSKPVLGAILALISCISCASWLIFQKMMSQTYPCFSSTALMYFFGTIQSFIYAIFTERDLSEWKLGWNIRLLTVAYSGIFASAFMAVLMAWCTQRRGPLFVSSFFPLMLVVVAVFASLLIDEHLHLGSIIGSLLIVVGLYIVLWGKRKEMNMTHDVTNPRCLKEDVNGTSSANCIVVAIQNHGETDVASLTAFHKP